MIFDGLSNMPISSSYSSSSSANQCADCLSSLPQSATSIHPAERGTEVHAMAIANLPVTAKLLYSAIY